MTHPSLLTDELSKILAMRKVEPEMIGSAVGKSFSVFVLEIVEKTLERSPKCKCCKLLSSSESRSFELKFMDKISTPVFTGQMIEGEGCASIKVALYDCLTGAVVKSGHEANANIELVVLKRDSDGDAGNDLTVEDLERKIVKAKKGKKSLLKGKTMLKLKEGSCDIGEISFVHNSDWVKICQLSLAARVVDEFPGTTIQPAMTEYFELRDCRTKLYVKHYPPALSDEIWRINKIGKNGALRARLRGENIKSVEDFLKLLVMEPERLKRILQVGTKTWEAITEHARTCFIDESVQFCYYSNPEHKKGVVLNVVGELKGLLRESQCVPIDVLSDVEKANARELVMRAFQHGEKLTPYHNENSFMITHPPFSRSLGLKNPNEYIHEPQVKLNTYDYARPVTSPHANNPSISCVGESSRPDHGHSHSDASMDFVISCVGESNRPDHGHSHNDASMDFVEALSDLGQGFDHPIHSPETAHHQIDDAMLLHFISKNPSMSQDDQSTPGTVLLDPHDVSKINVLKRWRRVFIILNAVVTVKSIGATGRFHAQKKRKLSSLVHK